MSSRWSDGWIDAFLYPDFLAQRSLPACLSIYLAIYLLQLVHETAAGDSIF